MYLDVDGHQRIEVAGTAKVFGAICTLLFAYDDGGTLRRQLAGSLLYILERIVYFFFHNRYVL